jgi:ketosteroid isomerase-like protein
MEAGDMATASATFAPALVYRLHGGHPLAGTFDGKQSRALDTYWSHAT